MKITDYGIWFEKNGIWRRVPVLLYDDDWNWVFMHGRKIGVINCDDESHIWIDELEKVGLKIVSNAPGYLGHRNGWDFPLNYIPSESDFEEIP